MDVAFIQQASTYPSLVLKKGHTCRCQPVTAGREPFLHHSIHFCKGSDQWRLCFLECWYLRKLELGGHLRPCAGKSLGCQCCSVRASRTPVAIRNHVASSGSQQEWAEHQTTFALRRSSMSRPELAIDSRFEHQSSSYRSPVLKTGTHAGVSQWPLWENHSLSRVAILAKGQINEECLLRNVDISESRHCRPCVKKILWLLMPSSDGFQESSHYQESRCLFQFGARMSRGSNNFCHAGRANICPRL